jgi:hypothetical protein
VNLAGAAGASGRYGQRDLGYLDPYTRRRVAAILLIVGVVVAGIAIADVGPFSDPPTEEEQAADTVEEFFASAADGDFKTFCGLLTPPARNLIAQRAGQLAQEEGLEGCAEILRALAGKELAENELQITESSVSGDRARVETELRVPGKKGVEQRSVLLQLYKDEWLIYDPGFG